MLFVPHNEVSYLEIAGRQGISFMDERGRCQLAETHHYPHKQLRAVITDELRHAIQRGDFMPGQWLRQEAVADRFGVSQMPVREAIKTLVAEGLVEHIPYRGARVVTLTAEDILDLHAQRAVLEERATAAAALRLTKIQISRLQEIVATMENHMATADLPLYRDLNRQFHSTIYQASGRSFLIRTLDQLWGVFPTMLWGMYSVTATASLPERDADDLIEHRRIVEALINGDAQAAAKNMAYHIQAAGHHFAAALRNAAA